MTIADGAGPLFTIAWMERSCCLYDIPLRLTKCSELVLED